MMGKGKREKSTKEAEEEELGEDLEAAALWEVVDKETADAEDDEADDEEGAGKTEAEVLAEPDKWEDEDSLVLFELLLLLFPEVLLLALLVTPTEVDAEAEEEDRSAAPPP